MRVLLIANPTRGAFYRNDNIPNLGLLTIAANLDKRHEVKIIDSFYQWDDHSHTGNRAAKNIYRIISEFDPQVIGLTAMTFQYPTARALAKCIRQDFRDKIIVLGGYHASLAYQEIYQSEDKQYFDFLVRNEGEITFNRLLQEIETTRNYSQVKGISYYAGEAAHHNEAAEILDLSQIKPPARELVKDEVFFDYTLTRGQFVETIATLETSRGCLHNCSFCSISQMYGKKYREYDLDRVIEDIKTILQANPNTERIAFIDDNITMNVERFEKLCGLIIEHGLNRIKYFAQCSSIGLSQSESLVKKMKAAGFDMVFLGIENIDPDNLKLLGKGNIVEKSNLAVRYLRKHGIIVIGGIIIGLPEDSRLTIQKLYRYLRKIKVDIIAASILTPYPATQIREEYLA